MRWKTKPVDQPRKLDKPRKADVIMLDGKHIIEAVVDLQNNKLLSWQPIKDAHGMVLLDDFASVQNIISLTVKNLPLP